MRYRFFAVAAVCATVSALPACTGYWATQPQEPAAIYAYRAGDVTESDLLIRLPEVLARYGYLIEDSERFNRRYQFTTQWKYRDPFEDERERGVERARTRIVMRARKHATKYALHLEIENMVRTDSGGWHHAPTTDRFEEYAGDIAEYIRASIAFGMRRF